ncbi:MAG: cytochrome c oxidase assembly protein [Magnetospirillum sp.]|nr:cytochrome c oxidase assembly protein [Magnetospirillum sp.]
MAPPRTHRRTVAASLAAVAAMLLLVAASVPLYRLFCAVTGTGGTPRIAASGEVFAAGDHMVTVRFDASVARGMPWRFEPVERQVQVRLGVPTLAFYRATNLSAEGVAGTAVFNVTPDKAGRYFTKIECFCFTEQHLEPHQSVDMPVTFVVDPALASDPRTEEVRTLTLSYTFFPARGPS